MIRTRSAAAIAVATLLAACGGSDGGGPTEPPVPTVTKVVVTPAASTIDQGATAQFLATAQDASGNTVTGQTVSWSSSNTAVATISSAGLATAVGAGTSAITATVAGVAGSAVLTVTQSLCASPTTVTLAAGQSQSFDATSCLVLPTGSSGDRYRVVVLRPAETGTAADVPTATLKVVGIGVNQLAPAPALVADQAFVPDVPGLSREAVRRALRVAEATERFHAELRARDGELLRTVGLENLRWARSRQELVTAVQRSVVPALATSPDKITLDISTAGDCSTTPASKKTAFKIHETDHLVFYQDSTQNATDPLTVAHATKMADYYATYGKPAIEGYFGKPSDIDGNGKVLVFVSPVVKDDVAAFVWSGDFFDNDPANPDGCAASNEAEVIYFNLDIIKAMDEGAHQALETLAHEVKHVVSIYNRIAASLRVGTAQYHPSWIEEGTAEIAGEMSSRLAWAAIGGPAPNVQVTRQTFVNTPGGIVPENYGVAIKLARSAWYLSSQPNGLVVEPDGAQDGASIYGSGWLFHRWLGDAYAAAASAPLRDSTLFRALNDSLASRGVNGIASQTGKSFTALLDEFATTVSLHKAFTGSVARDFTTYDFVSASEIFCTPNPLGVFPWPVTTTGTPGDCTATPRVNESSIPSASFKTAEYKGPIGITGMRIHDFVSNGTGTGAQITLDVAGPAKMIVARIR